MQWVVKGRNNVLCSTVWVSDCCAILPYFNLTRSCAKTDIWAYFQ